MGDTELINALQRDERQLRIAFVCIGVAGAIGLRGHQGISCIREIGDSAHLFGSRVACGIRHRRIGLPICDLHTVGDTRSGIVIDIRRARCGGGCRRGVHRRATRAVGAHHVFQIRSAVGMGLRHAVQHDGVATGRHELRFLGIIGAAVRHRRIRLGVNRGEERLIVVIRLRLLLSAAQEAQPQFETGLRGIRGLLCSLVRFEGDCLPHQHGCHDGQREDDHNGEQQCHDHGSACLSMGTFADASAEMGVAVLPQRCVPHDVMPPYHMITCFGWRRTC